jgi:hypothetical protein
MNTARAAHAAVTHRSSSMTAAGGVLALAFIFALCGPASAQGQSGAGAKPEALDEAGPPPLKYIPEEVRSRLAAAKDMKDRTKLCLALAEERLEAAAAQAEAERYEAATSELGVYEALVKDAIRFLQNSGRTTNKQRDLFKRIEMTLRAHTTKLETIRRAMPAHSGVYAQAALEFTREARAEALNSFFDDTVITDAPAPRAAEGERARGNALASPSKDGRP